MARLLLQPALALLLPPLQLQRRRRRTPQMRARGAGWRASGQGSSCHRETAPQGSTTQLLL